jgi:hypothetical protein
MTNDESGFGELPEWLELEHRVPVLERQVRVLFQQMTVLKRILRDLIAVACFAAAALVALLIDNPALRQRYSLEGGLVFFAIWVGAQFLLHLELAKIGKI